MAYFPPIPFAIKKPNLLTDRKALDDIVFDVPGLTGVDKSRTSPAGKPRPGFLSFLNQSPF